MRPLCACIAALLVSCFLMAAPAHGQVMMAEIRIDDGTAGNDDPAEYFELRGQPGTSISDLTYVVLGRRPIQTISGIPYWGAGVIVGLLKFPSGAVIGANGRYTVRQVGTPMYQGLSANLTTLLDFEDDATQSHLLVRNFDFGIFDDGTDPQVGFSPVPYDLDLDNDGALDITPWQEVVDGLSFLKSTTFDSENRAYAVQRVGPAQWGIPSHAWRCANNQNWRLGTQAFGLRTIGSQQVTAPSAKPFDGANPYDKVVLGVGEVGSAMRIKMTVYADMEDPTHTLSVLIDGVLVGTVAGGLPACGSGTITVTAPMDLVNQTLCRHNGNLPLQIIPSGNVAACAGSSCQVTLLFESPELTPGDSPQLFNAQCGCACDYPRGVIDVVFVVDTSESMADEAAALCSAIPDVINAISNQGALVNPMVLGITEAPGGDFGCLTSSVAATLGMFVPDSTGIPIRLLDHPESWGDAAAVVAWNYGWTTGAARLVVTISDEAPFEGSGILGNECDLADADSIANAIAVANARGVAVSTLVGTGAIDCVVDLATALAQGTGGGTAVTTLPSSQIAAIVADFILDATSAGCGSCRGDLNFDGVVDAKDTALFDCLRGHTCRDVNNDGVAGAAADRALTQAAHVCAAIDFCGITTQSCLVEHVTPGCMDAACCNLVCGTDPFCCETGWDGSCVVLAVQLCGACGDLSIEQGCFEEGITPGCNDAWCCEQVCAVDPICCAVQWDAVCVLLARGLCLDCGSPSTLNCFLPHSTPFCDNAACCNKVCAVEPICCDPLASWDVDCVALARTLCATCGSPDLSPCSEQSFSPACRDKTCCDKICNLDPACCEVRWDEQCVERANQLCLQCGSLLAGSCCLPHANPYCNDTTCCELVCAYDPFCCSGTWDGLCVSLATIVCPTLECPCGVSTGSCFAPHNGVGCSEALCCQQVCQYDDFCCLVKWDELCAAFATAQCGTNGACVPGAGSCVTTHATPGCDSPASCCSLVCSIVPDCCEVAWDFVCVDTAFQVCLNCGNPDSGSCYISSGSPGCSDATCCQQVCDTDPFCCTIGWDGSCVNLAFAICGDPLTACTDDDVPNRNCFMASRGRGCSPASCCGRVCNADIFCCTAEWDAICAKEAELFCPLNNNTNGAGSCFVARCCLPGAGCTTSCKACSDRGCGSAVCAYRLSCCTVVWDQECVELALAVCIDREICPNDDNLCTKAGRGPGCTDASCCNAVCDLDAHCCTYKWDAPCIALARDICVPESGWNCPCSGGCFEAKTSPGCADKSCCSAVCHIDPGCCTSGWDLACVSLARDVCCGLGLCGDPCNKSCLLVHPEPYCNDPYCCEAVCATDEYCCSTRWDTFCVQHAFERCAGVCGQPSAGNCFAEHQGTGCKDGACCALVCNADPTCCNEEWDSACATLARSLPKCVNVRPKCGEANTGSCCVPHAGPACENMLCCAAVCAQDPTCCSEEWDELCSDLAKTLPSCGECDPPCGATCAGSCCTPHANPRCDSLPCCEAVCFGWTDVNGVSYGGDAFCCNVEWDSNCVSRAFEYSQILLRGGRVLEGPCAKSCPLPQCGSPLAGDCCAPHGDPFCVDADCCLAVCAIDDYCCQVSWDANCVSQAFTLCPNCTVPLACGSGGSCFFPHFTPFCSDAKCCDLVCAVDPTCCSVQWDFDCVLTAVDLCTYTPEPPANDECAGAFDMVEGLNSFTNTGATQSLVPSPIIACDGSTTVFEGDVWFEFTPLVGGDWQVTTCDLVNFDTAIAIYEGPCKAATLRTCANDTPFCSQFTSVATFNGAQDTPYLIRIGSPTGGSGNGFVLIRYIGP